MLASGLEQQCANIMRADATRRDDLDLASRTFHKCGESTGASCRRGASTACEQTTKAQSDELMQRR